MSRSTAWRSPIFCFGPVALSCKTRRNKSNPEKEKSSTSTGESEAAGASGARLEEALDGVEGVDGDRGSADRRGAGGRVAGEHAVPERLAASDHRAGLGSGNGDAEV